jgi:hypothetical protein
MGERGWDYLWALAQKLHCIKQAARAVHRTKTMRLGAIARGTAGAGGSRSLKMSSVDIRNATRNLGDASFRAELAQSSPREPRINEVDSEEDPFIAMPTPVADALVKKNAKRLTSSVVRGSKADKQIPILTVQTIGTPGN